MSPEGPPGGFRLARGRAAEEAAARYLAGRGWKILARNARFPGGELDIVAREGKVVVFVEVRSARRGSPFAPEASLTPAKRENLVRAAAAWLARFGEKDCMCRFDLVAVVFSGGRAAIRHYPGAFEDEDPRD